MFSIQIQVNQCYMIQDYGASIEANEVEFNLQHPVSTTYTRKHHITFLIGDCNAEARSKITIEIK